MTEEKKRRIFGKKNLEQFERDTSGSYVYTGEYRRFAGSEAERKRAIALLWIFGAASLLCTVLAGILPYITTRAQFHIFLPYALSLILLIAVLWKLGRITTGGDSLRRYVFEETVKRLPGLVYAAMVFRAIHLAAIGVDAVSRVILTPAPYVLCIVLLAAAGLIFLIAFDRIRKKLQYA